MLVNDEDTSKKGEPERMVLADMRDRRAVNTYLFVLTVDNDRKFYLTTLGL